MSKKTIIAFGCTHIPHHDKENAAWIVEQIRERQPDIIVHLGDLIECESISSYMKVAPAKLIDEYREAEQFLQEVYDAHPKARRVFMQGNHEERMDRPEYAALAGLIDCRKHMKNLRRWKYREYIQSPQYTFTSGQLTFAHGWAYTKSGTPENKEGVDLSRGTAYGCYFHAHTHRPVFQQVSLSTWKLPFWRCNVGCGIDFRWVERDYAKGMNISQWQHALAYGWHETKRRYDGKRNWEIELIKRKGAWE